MVTRTNPPTSYYPKSSPFPQAIRERSIFQRLRCVSWTWLSRIFHMLNPSFDWWRPLRFSCCLRDDKSYSKWISHFRSILYLTIFFAGSVFKSLRFIPSGHHIPLSPKPSSSPYRIFFNLYKPSTPFRKTAPPPPDFPVVVVKYATCNIFLHSLLSNSSCA